MAGDLPRIGLFAVVPQDAGDLFPAGGVHEVCRRLALLAHPHIQRGVCPVRKAPGRVVQLMAGNTEVQQRTVYLLDAEALEGLSGVAEVYLHHRGREPGQPRPGGLHRVGVLVEGDEPPAFCAIQPEGDLAGVSRAARRAVEISACRVDVQSVEALVQKHGDMLKRGRVELCQIFCLSHRAQPPFVSCSEPSDTPDISRGVCPVFCSVKIPDDSILF